jgi:class 3 adenylate cyclase
LRVGAAVGTVLFIPEDPNNPSPIQAIGEAINIAVRLQSLARPNRLYVSNRLKTHSFERDEEFTEEAPKKLRNIGIIANWSRDLYGASK